MCLMADGYERKRSQINLSLVPGLFEKRRSEEGSEASALTCLSVNVLKYLKYERTHFFCKPPQRSIVKGTHESLFESVAPKQQKLVSSFRRNGWKNMVKLVSFPAGGECSPLSPWLMEWLFIVLAILLVAGRNY